MATMFPPPTNSGTLQSPPQNFSAPQGHQRFRTYTPYVFQPNFLKQMRPRRGMSGPGMGLPLSGANSMQLNDAGKFTQHSSQHPMPNNSGMMSSGGGNMSISATNYDDSQRKKSGRRVIDWTSSCALYLEKRKFERDVADVPDLMPDTSFTMEMQTALAYRENPVTSVTSKFIRSATNKMKCPVYKVVWTPDGRRLVTGSASGEFTLWNGTAFNFETILQAHDCPVRAMSWSKNDNWLITGDNQGYIKYWQLNMNNVKMYQAHKDQACRSVSFGPTDHKFVTASDDGTVRVWDFLRCHEERILRGHGADVKQVDWHPHKGLIASASKDLHTPVKLWDPKIGQSLTTLHAHKGTVMDVKWNANGNWFLSASRDHLIKLFDIRNLKQEMQVFRGHKKEAFSVAWHPIHEDLFASGGSEGSILFWQVGEEKEVGGLEGAHDSLIWSLAWHPLGNVLVSGSNDHSTKFWARNRPGDSMRDRYNMSLLRNQQDDGNTSSINATNTAVDSEDNPRELAVIPGMGDADVAAAEIAKREEEKQKSGIPGLDWSYEEKNEFERKLNAQSDNRKKIPYARPVPKAFVAAWEANKEGPPLDRPRSPYAYDRDRHPQFDQRGSRFHRMRYEDDRPRNYPSRDGHFRGDRPPRFPDRPPGWRRDRPPGSQDDDKIYVDGIEVGPEFKPDEIMDMDRKFEPNDRPMPPMPVSGPGQEMDRDNRGMPNQEHKFTMPNSGPDAFQERNNFPPPPHPDRFRDERGEPGFGENLGEFPPFRDVERGRFREEFGFPVEDNQMMDEEMFFDEHEEPQLLNLGRGNIRPPHIPDRFPGRGRGGFRDMDDMHRPMGREMGMRGRGEMRGRGFFHNRDQPGWGHRGGRSPPSRMRRGMRPHR